MESKSSSLTSWANVSAVQIVADLDKFKQSVYDAGLAFQKMSEHVPKPLWEQEP